MMSRWVHLAATIRIDTFCECKNIAKYVEEILKDAPKIIGSEGNAYYYANSCEQYGDYNVTNVSRFGINRWQTTAVITIEGDLRDTNMKQVEKEYDDFLEFIYNHFPFIDQNICVIHDEFMPIDKVIKRNFQYD